MVNIMIQTSSQLYKMMMMKRIMNILKTNMKMKTRKMRNLKKNMV